MAAGCAKAADPGDARIANTRIKADLGWSPGVDLRAGLRLTRAYHASRSDAYLQ